MSYGQQRKRFRVAITKTSPESNTNVWTELKKDVHKPDSVAQVLPE